MRATKKQDGNLTHDRQGIEDGCGRTLVSATLSHAEGQDGSIAVQWASMTLSVLQTTLGEYCSLIIGAESLDLARGVGGSAGDVVIAFRA